MIWRKNPETIDAMQALRDDAILPATKDVLVDDETGVPDDQNDISDNHDELLRDLGIDIDDNLDQVDMDANLDDQNDD